MAKSSAASRAEAQARCDRLALMKQEAEARRVASRAGRPIPPTPNLDAFEKEYQTMTSTRKPAAEKSASGRLPKPSTDVVYYRNGKPLPGSHAGKLSTLAYFNTKGISSPDSPRLSTKELVALLATPEFDIQNPTEPGWGVELPNGTYIDCQRVGVASKCPAKYKDKVAPKESKPKSPKRAASKDVTQLPKTPRKRPSRAKAKQPEPETSTSAADIEDAEIVESQEATAATA